MDTPKKLFLIKKYDETEKESPMNKAAEDFQSETSYSEKAKEPMDTNISTDCGEISGDVQINLNFVNQQEEPSMYDKFDIERIFDAVSSGDIARLNGLEEYLNENNKKLTSMEYRPSGKTALMKALLNTRNGQNDTVEHLLEIAERMGHLDKLINAAYTDPYYEGQAALHIAIERRNKHFAKLLLDKGAKVHAKACGKFFQPHGETCFYFGELPLSLAACTNQKEMVDLLLEEHADIRHTDSWGNTVLHALVMVADNSDENTNLVVSMYDYILTKDAVQNPKQTKLEDIENNQGLTPIKLAAKKGKIGLFEHILHREFHQEECRHLSRKFTEWAYGPVYSSLYDLNALDTYEKNSVLEIVVYGTEIPNRLEMLQIEPLNNLLEDKWIKFAFGMFVLKALFYLFYLIIFTLICYYRKTGKPKLSFEKTTEGYLELVGQVIVIIASLYFFIRGLMDITRKRPTLQTLLIDGYSDMLFSLQALLFLICVALYCAEQQVYLCFLVVCLALSWINLLYFFRGSQHMGIYSVMIQRMIISHILRFLFVYIVFLIGFSTALVTLLEEETTTDDTTAVQSRRGQGRLMFIDVPNSAGCKKPALNDFSFTVMELFKFTIGMGELEFTEKYQYKHVFYFLLISYIVLTYILLLNMLIALMNKSVEEMSEESARIWKLQRAITILDIERSCFCLKKKLRSGVEKNLGQKDKEDCRWCLRVEEVNWKKWNHNLSLISEEPGDFGSDISPQTEYNQGGFLRTLSLRRSKRNRTEQGQYELKLLTSISE